MEHVTSYLDLPVSDMQMKMVGHMSNSSESHYFSVSNEQMSMVEPMSSQPEVDALMVPNNQAIDKETFISSMDSNPVWMVNDSNMLNGERTSFPVKRKAEIGPLSYNSISQPSLLSSKRPAHIGGSVNSFGFVQPSAPEKKREPEKQLSPRLQAQSLMNKKMVRNDAMPGKPVQRGPTAKAQTKNASAQKAHPESSGAVRSKMRESLAAALELASQKPGSPSTTGKEKTNATITHQMPPDSKASESNLTDGGGSEVFSSGESAVVGKTSDSQVLSAELPSNESSGNGGKIFQDFQYNFLPDEEVPFGDNFLVKDDLLQGNGLSWAFEFDMQMREGPQAQYDENPLSVEQKNLEQNDKENSARSEEVKLSPEKVAFEIEAELFKLYGGVNKKYKEKGRSLLFNLKDRNNPELRERVMSGEISPERLCSMSAEELASKELSEWRTAKAEELAQMVVLPDTEVDVRRLVKKTHKGEYQVEVEQDYSSVTDVSGGSSVFTALPRKEKTEMQSPRRASPKDKVNVAGQEGGSGNQEFSGSLVIPTDGTDLLQGMMTDELKDPALLPPIVSLDEFMESLDAEPPFENLSADAGMKTSLSHEENPKSVKNSQASDRASDSPRDASSKMAGIRKHDAGMPMKSSGSPTKQKVIHSAPLKVEYIWQGKLQLTLSSSITVAGLFQSGEKTSTKDWSTSVEIKGKVRLDAFEKFLQDLPMSRTRAVMVLLFVLKDKSSKDEHSNLSEAIESFSADERLGYAEPAAGVELYLCPRTSKMTEMLNKHMTKERLELNDTNEDGLMGVVVWRRAHISNTISPNSSSHHKHSSKKQPFAPPKRGQDSLNVNVNNPIRNSPSGTNNIPRSQPQTEEDDDIPPGFGPTAAARSAKDEDDLPEFNFSSNLTPPASKIALQSQHRSVKLPERSVDQVRELIKKYGQSETNVPSRNLVNNRTVGIGIEPWNDDDDDDMPEWRPQAPHHLHQHVNPIVHRQPLPLRPVNQHLSPVVTQPALRGAVQPLPGGRWAQPPGPLHGGGRWRQ